MKILLDVTKIPLNKVQMLAIYYDCDLILTEKSAFLMLSEVIYNTGKLVKDRIITIDKEFDVFEKNY